MDLGAAGMNLVLFTVALVTALVVERALHAFSFTLLYLTCRTLPSEKARAIVSLQVSSGAINSVFSIFTALCTLVLQAAAVLMQYALTVFAMLLLSIILYVMFQYANDIMFEASMTYNRALGPSLQILLVWPLKVLTWLFDQLCPLWNAFVWFSKKLPPQLLVETVTHNIGLVLNAVESLGNMFISLAMSLLSWVQSFVCCTAEQTVGCNPRCMEAGERIFDLLTPMAHLRNLVVWITQWLREMCFIVSGPMDLITYPFMDINFAKGTHFLGNSILYGVFHVPAVTVERCNRFKADGAIMCVPDFEPVFNMMVSGFRYMGLFIDNWLDVLILIVEGSLGRAAPKCNALPDLLRNFDFKANTFGSNETLIVGMTEYMFARTDGTSVQYFSMDRDWQTVVHPNAFPFDVNLKYGVAAVSHLPDADHDPKGDDTTGLMGCKCDYTSVGIQFTCGVAMFTDAVSAADRTVPVRFQLPSTAMVLQCSKVMVRVESVRWPVSRFTATRVQRVDGSYAQDVGCASKGTCLMADAAIWIRPMCSVDNIDLACVESFKQASCFPYCMALHVRGSGTQTLVLYDADEWNSGVTLLKRDCGLYKMEPTNTTLNGISSTGLPIRVSLPNSVYGLDAAFEGAAQCAENPQTMSRLPRASLLEYGNHASVILDDQPFLFAGDLALTAMRGQAGIDGLPTYSIKVQRVYGNQANEFTTIPLNQNIPSLGPCRTPSDCTNIDAQCQSAEGCKAAIPYGYDHTSNGHVLGTTTQRFLFWVTNPSLEPFYAFSLYCKNRNNRQTNKLQISVISSYGGIRLWRMDPYIYCPEIDGVSQCPEQQNVLTRMVQSLDFEEFTEELCDVPFNVMAVDLDYINEDNLALTVLRTTLANVDTVTLRPINQSSAEYVTIWVNPTTLEQRNDTLWMPEASSPALAQGFLCPSQRRMPNFGSLIAEAVASVIFIIRLPLNLLLSFPVILDLTGAKCPLLNRGHHVLKTCGSELLSLEDFFNSVYRCNTLFWMVFNIIADSFGPGTPQTFINGAAVIAENNGAVAMLPGAAAGLSSAGDVDPSKITEVLSNSLSALPTPIQAAKLAMKNPIANAHFYYRMGSRMLMQIIETSQRTRTVGNLFWNVIADGVKDYDDIVLQRMRRTCGGFAILAGFNTPLGRMVNRWCTAWVEMQKGFLTMATVFFVDVPLMDCICVKSTGSMFSRFVKSTCWPDAPDLQKPLVNALMQLTQSEACPVVVKMTQTHFTESLDPMFALLEAGTRELASVMDYFIQINYVGDCNNYADNPYVLTLIPQPADYFRVCGKTPTCRLRCLNEFQAFEARNIETPVTETVTESVQSLFFNSVDDDTYMPLRPLAIMELYDCSYACGVVQEVGPYRDRCILLAGENGQGMLEVISFCVPVQLGSNVRRGKQSWTVENLVPGALQTGFVFDFNPADFWQSFRLLVRTDTSLYVCHANCVKLADAVDFGAVRILKFVILGNQVVLEALKLDGLGVFTTTSTTYCFRFAAYGMTPIMECKSNLWEGSFSAVCAQDFTNQCAEVLLLPKTSMDPVRKCGRAQANLQNCVVYRTQTDFVYKTSFTSAGLISQSATLQGDPMVWHVLMTAPPDQVSHWLLVGKVSLTPTGDVVGSSGAGIPAQLQVNVVRKCSLDNCVGCRDLGLQRLCYAASQCQVARCIGTMVHQRRPLCSIGMNLAAAVQNLLSLTEGAWLIVSETMVSVLALSGGVKPSSSISWPDQAFFGYICSAKDVTATGISIITSSINGVVQSVGEIPVVQASQPTISNNAFILFSMTMAATTNFLNQIALMPLYAMMATQKTFICSANSVLAVVGGDQMSMTLGDPAIQELSSKATGKCMSQYFSESTQGEGTGSDNKGSMVAGAVTQLVSTFNAIKLDFLVHPLDATFTWMQGVISGLQDVVQTIDRNRCKLPDMSAKDSFNCACGDKAFKIVPERRLDSWVNQGFWCSTTMTMMNYDGNTKYVWNPYTLAELEQVLLAIGSNGKTKLDDYLYCVATGGTCTPPSTPVFDRQQVSMIAVYQRCLANYQSRQWDMGAHVLFDKTLHKQIQATLPVPDCFALPDGECVSDCLLRSQAKGSSNEFCFNEWLRHKNINSLDFFEYEEGESSNPHACQVFSGPSKLPGALGEPFRICLDEYEDQGLCKIPSIVWSGRSTNKIPVGLDHSTVIKDPTLKVVAARNEYASIKRDVTEALNAMANWNASNLNVMVFSAEGDMLHQFFDCFMMGAAGSAQVWPGTDVENSEQPIWARNEGLDREFQLPCSGEALKDRLGKRDSKSPFTCGTPARRSAIKYFLRNLIQANPTNNSNIVRDAVKELVANLTRAWVNVDIDSYMCQCSNGTQAPECCVLDPSCNPATTKCPCEDGSEPSYACCDVQCKDSTFLPPRFQVQFAKIKGQNMVQSLFDQAAAYLTTTVWTDNRPWLLYDMGGAEAYNWSNSKLQAPLDDSMFDTTQPVQAYDHSELGYPFRTTVYEMCFGLLQQVHMTMPMKDGKPTTLTDPYDPDKLSTILNVTYREDFVRKLVQDAYKHSPIFWHYVVRHTPSDSAMCRKAAPERPSATNTTYFVQGYNALKIGGHEVDCYCGWWHNASHCAVPSSVCERLVLLIGSTEVQDACNGGRIATQTQLLDWMPQLIVLEGGWKGWPCPSMWVSDHWGIVADQTTWLKGTPDMSGTANLILQNGTSGLRVGSLDWVKHNIVNHINPAQRKESIQSLQCTLSPPPTLVDHFVDDLFPALQGVRQSAPVSACLRFTIELARLTAYQEAGLVVAAADQSSIVGIWRRRCEIKLKQVAFCEIYGVFEVKQVESTCPFSVSIIFRDEYTLTPNCLVVYNKKVYDPCLCDAKWCSPTSDQLFLTSLNANCQLYHVRDMVIDAVVGLPPWPATSNTAVPRPLARSQFALNVLYSPNNVANNPGHWAVAEGDIFYYCDLVVDWWPDEWKHPVGYHVTMPCTDASPRTFDSAWAALRVGTQLKMMHVPNALRNRTMQTSVYGAAGACRTHNYGMPTKVINTMRFCTQADNRAVDPTVPSGANSTAEWGTEYCTQSPYEVPWSNGPSSVGTHFNYLVDLLPFAGWGDNAGHAPFKACTSDAQCCATCKCLLSKAGGVCARMQPGTFECANHHHCVEKLCAGDGKCVQPTLEVHNNATYDAVVRALTDNCSHSAFDTWGTSKEDIIPDLLENSGMCSYRSWFEQRNLKTCNASYCSVDGSQAWMFTKRTPRAAFEAGVLGVKAHPCDRDYEHLEGLVSCNPGSANALLRDAGGITKTYSQGVFTQTYRPNRWLPVVKHDWTNQALGFIGMPRLYSQLGYGSMTVAPPGPLLRPCSNFGLCAVQSSAGLWYANGNNEPVRFVTVGGTPRPYTIDDQMLCGSMGFVDNTVCRIDPAVVPLFYVLCNDATVAGVCSTYTGGTYTRGMTKAQLQTVATNLNTLFGTMQISPVDTWAQYVVAADKAKTIWESMKTQAWSTRFSRATISHTYNGAAPRGLYFLLSYSAYELPFAWWWRCSWLSGISVTINPAPCEAWDGLTWAKESGGETYTVRNTTMKSIGRKQWLAQAGGIYLESNIQASRNLIHQRWTQLVNELSVPQILFACYNEADYLRNETDVSYNIKVLQVVESGTPWPTTQRFENCTGLGQCLTHSDLRVDATKDLVNDIKEQLRQTTPFSAGSCKAATNVVPQVCAFAQDHPELATLLSGVMVPKDIEALAIFSLKAGTGSSLASKYDERIEGCNIIHCCDSNYNCPAGPRRVANAQCRCFKKEPSELEINMANLVPRPTVAPYLIFSDALPAPAVSGTNYVVAGSNYVALDLCTSSGKSSRCTYADPLTQEDCTPKSDAQAKEVQNTYCATSGEFYGQQDNSAACLSKLKDGSSECLGANTVANRYITKPVGIPMSVMALSIPNKTCYKLKCPTTGIWKAFNDNIVYDPNGFSGQYRVEVKVTSIRMKYSYGKINHYTGLDATGKCPEAWVSGCDQRDYVDLHQSTQNVEVWIGYSEKAPTKQLTFGTAWCNVGSTCKLNTKNTRALLAEYQNLNSVGLVRTDSVTYPELDNNQIYEMAKTIIENIEDYFDSVRPSPACQENNNNKIHGCINNDAYIFNAEHTSCSPLSTWFVRYIPSFCTNNKLSQWYLDMFCPRQSDKCGWGCCKDYTKQCIAKGTKDVSGFLARAGYACINVEYAGSFDDSCTRTTMQCEYNEGVQNTLVKAGLPNEGFCPECVATVGCSPTKAAKTYQLVKNNIIINDIVPTTLTGTNPRMPSTARHFHMKMDALNEDVGVPLCGPASCGDNFYKVELYRNMFVCLPCKVVPPKYCTGQHMCSFTPWDWKDAPLRDAHANVFNGTNATFAEVVAAVRANLLALLPTVAYQRPAWHEMLEPYKFTSYNPQELKTGFNDNMESLDGYCATNNKLPVFTDCQNDVPRRTLKTFSQTYYKVSDGSTVPQGHTLTWFAGKAQLMGTMVAAFHMAARQAYFNELFDDAVCKNGTIANLICFQNKEVTPVETLTVNPVMSGRFEVQEGCDVEEIESTRVIDSSCNFQTCPPPPASDPNFDPFNTFTGTAFNVPANQMRCKIRNGATAAYLSTPRSYASNLCSRQPTVPRTCDMPQGVLNQGTVDGEPASTVYARLRWGGTAAKSGLLGGGNDLLNMRSTAALGNITLDPWDIGGHSIRMRLGSDGMRVVGLPLQSYSTLAGAASINTVDWVGAWRMAMATESRTMDQLYALKTCASWDCPLRRNYFWSGQGASFRPQSPNPFRANALYGAATHPTTKPALVPAAVLASYKTRNGFCVCAAGDSCLPASGSCSSADTIASLSDMQQRLSQATQPACDSQVDWPYTGGNLRDDSSMAPTVSGCGVLGRLPQYRYRYKNSETVLGAERTSSGAERTTLDEGGDCHMGRAATYNAAAQSCTLVAKRDAEIVVNCGAANITLARPKSANVNLAGRRRRCAQCDPLPTYHAADGTNMPESEVSHGKLWRWAPARKLAQDLRFRLCGNATTCPELKADRMELQSFWFDMMRGGLTGSPGETVEQLFNTVQEDPDEWNDEPWMLCTNNGDGLNCQGTASKREWLADRAGTCSAMKTLPNADDAVADLSVCDLDESLDNLCRVVQNARYRLFEANCKLSGSCRTSSFFYQPATFSASNDQLSRQTVQYFYDFTVAGSCPAMTEELKAIIAQNQKTAQECSAQSLEMFQLAISAARQVIHFFVKIFYYMSEIGMNVISLVMTTDPNPIIKQIMTYFNMIINEFQKFFVTMGDMFYKMIMDTGQLGKFIRDLIFQICSFLSFLIDNVVKPVTCFVREFVIKLIEGIKSIAGFITFGAVKLDFMDGWKKTVEEKFECDFRNPFNCTPLDMDASKGPSRLPMPTRCWVGYKPQVGDQKGLGCSASDTCMDDDMSLLACAACSGGSNGSRVDMNRYGCDALTKLCRCHTFPVGRSQCSSHQECLLPDVECGFVDAYLQPSFGNVPCARCSQNPICLITGSVGQCTCTLRSTGLQTCPAQYHAQRVSPDPTQLCLISLGLSASSSSSYSANYRDLASTPCANLNGAQTWCLNIWLDQGGSAYMTVGLAMLKGRRLLADTPHNFSAPNWTMAYEPCRSLMTAHSLGILEAHVASDCERWRQIGERAILMYNLSNATDVQFTSYTGLAEADVPFEVYMFLAQHAEWIQPVSVVARRYAYMLRPLLNRTIGLLAQLQNAPSVQENVHVVKDLLPWFAANATPEVVTMANGSASGSVRITNASERAGRRLLATWKDNLQSVKRYSYQLANGNAANLAPDLASEWSRGPFFWPPSYSYADEQHLCLAGELAFNLSLNILHSTVRYYTKTGPQRPEVARTFQGALPQLGTWKGSAPKEEPWLVGSFKQWAKDLVGVDFTAIKTYTTSPDGGNSPSQFSEDLSDLVRCDFEKVQHCTGHRRSLFWGGVVVALGFGVVSFFFKLLNVPMVDPLLFMIYVPCVTLYVFQTSVTCFPMVPTCFMGEVLDLVQTIMPVSYSWPVQMLQYEGCMDGLPPPPGLMVMPATSQCFRECTEPPFEFVTWEDNVAWIQCEVWSCDTSFVDNYYRPWVAMLPIPQPFYGILQMERYTLAAKRKAAYIDMPDHRDAQRLCALFTIFNVVPVALAVVGVAVIVLAAAALAVAVLQSVVSLALSLVAFIHSY